MKPEIKKRIEQIKSGDIPKGYIKKYKYIFPDAWKLVNLGSVTKRKSEKNKERNDLKSYSINNQVGFIQQEEQFSEGSYQDVDKSNYKVVKPGEFAYNPARVNIGSIGLQKEDVDVIISSLYVCFGLDKSCSKTYFENWFKSYDFNKEITRNLEGSVREYLFYENFSNIKLPIPSLAEQKEIAEILMQCDKVIELYEKEIDELQKLKKTYLKKMFPQKGEKVPEIRFNQFTEPWRQLKVRDVANRYDNLRVPVAAHLRISGTTPYYGANGIQDYVEGFTHEGEFVLVAEDGANDLKNYPVKCVNGRIWVNNHTHVLQGKPETADNQFLAYSINQADIESLLVGGGRAKLNAETLMDIKLTLPSLVEQRTVGLYLKGLDNIINLHERKLEEKKKYKKSLMQLLLTGIVRVNV